MYLHDKHRQNEGSRSNAHAIGISTKENVRNVSPCQ
jgi:hypothetical protein